MNIDFKKLLVNICNMDFINVVGLIFVHIG